MALSVATLTAELRKIMDPAYEGFSYPTSRAAAISRWTSAYDTYAQEAVDASGDEVSAANAAGFSAAITSGWIDAWTYEEAASAFRDAFIAYWTGATFAVGSLIGGTGTVGCQNQGTGNRIFGVEYTSVVSNVNDAALYAALLNELSILRVDGAVKAQAIAEIFHAATISGVLVQISGLDTTPPPINPQPVTNVCVIS
jgi:hypothetical protein